MPEGTETAAFRGVLKLADRCFAACNQTQLRRWLGCGLAGPRRDLIAQMRLKLPGEHHDEALALYSKSSRMLLTVSAACCSICSSFARSSSSLIRRRALRWGDENMVCALGWLLAKPCKSRAVAWKEVVGAWRLRHWVLVRTDR